MDIKNIFNIFNQNFFKQIAGGIIYVFFFSSFLHKVWKGLPWTNERAYGTGTPCVQQPLLSACSLHLPQLGNLEILGDPVIPSLPICETISKESQSPLEKLYRYPTDYQNTPVSMERGSVF